MKTSSVSVSEIKENNIAMRNIFKKKVKTDCIDRRFIKELDTEQEITVRVVGRKLYWEREMCIRDR